MPVDAINAEIINAYNAAMEASGLAAATEPDVAQNRAFYHTMSTQVGGPEVAEVRDIEIDSHYGKIGARLYHPQPGTTLPGLVYYHGGGWVIGDLDTHDAYCRHLASAANIAIVSVDYRLAPEVAFPVPFEDCYAAKEWVAAHAAKLGIDPSCLAIGGDSAGGNLTAAVALATRDRGGARVVHQLLIYPCVLQNPETGSYDEYGEGHVLTADTMHWFWAMYFGGQDVKDNPYACPANADSLADLPPATVITAECDVLRDEGEAYAMRLARIGNDMQLKRFNGTFHGFSGMVGAVPQADEALAFTVQRLGEAFA